MSTETENFNNIDAHALKQTMSTEQVWDFCRSLGIDGSYIDDDKLVFETACHNKLGHGKHKLYYYGNTKLFSCYTGCGGSFDIFELLVKMSEMRGVEVTLDEAINSYSDTLDFLVLGDSENQSSKVKEIDKPYKKPVYKYYNKALLNRYRKAVSKDWLKEGISLETQRKYELMYEHTEGGIAYPHYSQFGKLLGVRERFLSEDTVKRMGGKYMPVKQGEIYLSSPLSTYLFGINHNQTAMRYKKKAIIFEGEKSVMLADEYMGENNYSAASFGMKFSRHQFEILKNLGVEEIIFAFDRQYKQASTGDPEFNTLLELYQKIASNYEPFGIKITFMLDLECKHLEYKDSPIDKGIETFHTMFQERKTIEEIFESDSWMNFGNMPMIDYYIDDDDLPF